jgi:hypothetical protein
MPIHHLILSGASSNKVNFTVPAIVDRRWYGFLRRVTGWCHDRDDDDVDGERGLMTGVLLRSISSIFLGPHDALNSCNCAVKAEKTKRGLHWLALCSKRKKSFILAHMGLVRPGLEHFSLIAAADAATEDCNCTAARPALPP